tara:strand:- start:295 stop:546 length:252 start_codon:yes stop_codon:yes gene_type:complete
MCFFNPKIDTPASVTPTVKQMPTINTGLPKSKKLDTAEDATKKVQFGSTARAASQAKQVGTSELKININAPKTAQKSGGVNLA